MRAGRHDASLRLAVLRQDQWLAEHLNLGGASSTRDK